jgi:hypothetical protein
MHTLFNSGATRRSVSRQVGTGHDPTSQKIL